MSVIFLLPHIGLSTFCTECFQSASLLAVYPFPLDTLASESRRTMSSMLRIDPLCPSWLNQTHYLYSTARLLPLKALPHLWTLAGAVPSAPNCALD